jgi:predicted secreted protein
MKFRNIITVALASALVLAACTKEEATDSFENIKLDKTYLSIDPDGGSASVKITATEAWHLNAPDSSSWKKSKTWVTPSDTAGVAGESVLSFKAEANTGREVSLTITCGSNTQNLVIRQGDLAPTKATCEELIAGKIPEGKTVIVEGTCKNIYNTTYGNWYLNDGTGEITIYGTLYEGQTQQFSKLGIEEGDVVKVQGPYKLYGTTHELENVTVLNITKSLAKVETESHDVEKEGETFDVKISYKGNGLNPAVPEAYQDWISILSVTTKEGTKTKIDKNPADTAFVKIKVAPNEGGDREGQVNFTSSTSDSSSEVYYTFTQKGAIIAATVEEFLAAAEGNIQYRVTGVITKISASSKYHNADITVASGDFTKTVLLYRAKTSEGNIEDLNLAEGDIVTVVGKRSSHNGSAQMAEGGILESYKHYAPATVAEFLAAANNSEFAVTGKIVKVADLSGKSSHNNVSITIQDGDNSLYLYRVTTYDQSDVAVLNPEVGGTVTVAGKRGEYKGAAQMAAGGVVLAYTAPTEDGGDQQPEYETIWSEDWSAYKADDVPTDPYTCTGTTKIYKEALAGGTAPEILVGKNGGTLAVKISDLKGKTGDFRFSFKCNKDFLTVTCSDDVKVTEVTKGKEFTLTVPSNVKTFTVTITNPNSSNARVDDLKLEVKK